jgi:aspartate kinase
MKIIVQKFGGTSVANEKNREKVISKIISKLNEGYRIVVVVSAIGREGDPYATDSLLKLVNMNHTNQRELDLLVSCGEIISSVVLSSQLNHKGYDTVVYNGHQAGIITDENYGNAQILAVSPEKIISSLNQKKIVIVAGFQGASINGEITTLGRGGSDTSALILGEALGCDYVEIYTDVDGIMTADPKLVPDAKLIETMCYSEVYQLAEEGAKVIHPKAVEVAERGNIKVVVKNTLSECCGTTITHFDFYKSKNDNIISAITYMKKRAQVTIEMDERKDNIENLFADISNKNISIDLINLFMDKEIFTINQNDISSIEELLILGNYKYKIIPDCCKISVVGHRMRGIPGVMARIVKALTKEKIAILQSSDSHTTIWCLVNGKDSDKALRALHNEFKLGSK